MNDILRLFVRDLAELARRRGLLALVLAVPVALMLLIGNLRVHDPLTTVALVETADEAAGLGRVRDALDDLSGVKVIPWTVPTGAAHERAVREGVDVVAEWAGGEWRFHTPWASRYRMAYAQEVVQDLVLSQQRHTQLESELEALAALREVIAAPATSASEPAPATPASQSAPDAPAEAASTAATAAPHPALAQVDAIAQRVREEAEIPTPLLRAWLASRLQPYFAPATRADHSLVPGYIALIAVFLPFLLGSTALVREREAGTLPTVLLATRRRWTRLAAGKLLLPLFVAFLATLLLLVAARSAFGFGIKPGVAHALAVQAVAALVSALFGLSLSTFVESAQDAYTASAVYLVALILLTGLIYPVEEAAAAVAVVAHAFPLTLSGPPLEAWMNQGQAAPVQSKVWIGLGLQLLAAVGLCAVSLRRLREGL